MTYRQEELGCDFIDVLEEAALTRQLMTVKLANGSTFNDQVRDVVTRDGRDWVVFYEHGEMPVSTVLQVRPMEPTRH